MSFNQFSTASDKKNVGKPKIKPDVQLSTDKSATPPEIKAEENKTKITP